MQEKVSNQFLILLERVPTVGIIISLWRTEPIFVEFVDFPVIEDE